MQSRCVISLLLVISGSLVAGCSSAPQVPAAIDTHPSYAVRYATNRISPAVVQLNIVSEEMRNGELQTERSLGSGVIIDPEGHILTNFHVAGRAKRIDVVLASKEHVRAKLVGSDHWTDLALVQLDMNDIHQRKLLFQVAALGRSSNVELGEPVMAIGTPFGLSRTVTSGIISNTDRYFDENTIDGYETGWFNNWIQTDAAINPGNSGGPLVNLRGEVIGINTRGIPNGNNMGFAIPIDTALGVVDGLKKQPHILRSYVGFDLEPIQDFEHFYKVPDDQGVLIANIDPESPAEIAGLKPEDVLMEIDGKPVSARFPEELAAIRKRISEYPVGSHLSLTILRPDVVHQSPQAGEETRNELHFMNITTDKLESAVAEPRLFQIWGLTVRDVTRPYLRERRLAHVQGALVLATRSGSLAERARMQMGDIIVDVNGRKIAGVDELALAVKDWEQHPSPVSIDVSRDRSQTMLVLKP